MNPVTIVPADIQAIDVALQGIPPRSCRWIWIGEELLKGQNFLAKRGTEVQIHERLKRLTYELHDEYVRYVGKTAKSQQPDWWRSAVSEKNPYVSNTFFFACCVHACLEAVKSAGKEEQYLLVVQDPALRRALCANLKTAGCDVSLLNPLRLRLRAAISNVTQLFAHHTYFIMKNAVRIGYARHRYRLHKLEPLEMLRRSGTPICLTNVWIDRRAFSPETGEFRDMDFDEVAAVLRKRGKTVIGLANIQNAASYQKVAGYIRASKSVFLVQHAFLRFRDLLISTLHSLLHYPRQSSYPMFSGLEIGDLIFSDLRREWYMSRDSSNVLIERWVERLKQSGIRIERFIYTFENHAWERVICRSLRAAYPSVRLMGYQPNGVPLMMMNYFISKDESESTPLPDRIITNGAYSARLLSASGFRPERVISGGGLRQAYLQPLLYGGEKPTTRKTQSKRLLITPSIGRPQTIELIRKTVAAFKDELDLSVIIKFHPAIQFEQLQHHLQSLKNSPNISISTQSISELLPTVDLLIYNDGTFPAVEALTFGLPIVFVEPDYGLSLDSLDGYPKIRRTARTPQEMREAAREALTYPRSEQEISKGIEVVRDLVGRVTTATLELFCE